MRAGGRGREHGRKHMGLRVTRDPVEPALIAYDREHPRLLVYGVRRVHGAVDQTTDGLLINGLRRVFTRRAAGRDCLVDIHYATPRFRPARVHALNRHFTDDLKSTRY